MDVLLVSGNLERNACTMSVFRPNGETICVRTYAVPGVPVAQTVIASAARALAGRVRGSGEVPGSAPARFESQAKQRAPAGHASVQRSHSDWRVTFVTAFMACADRPA
jgi:hypothetical protein